MYYLYDFVDDSVEYKGCEMLAKKYDVNALRHFNDGQNPCQTITDGTTSASTSAILMLGGVKAVVAQCEQAGLQVKRSND